MLHGSRWRDTKSSNNGPRFPVVVRGHLEIAIFQPTSGLKNAEY